MYDVAIIGGGLAGLVNAIQLSRAGLSVCLIEKKHYPFHKVCGEYVSNEVGPFLRSINACPSFEGIPQIHRLILSDTQGNSAEMPLPLGGFAMSRYRLDHFLYKKAISYGTTGLLGTVVDEVNFKRDHFVLTLSSGQELAAHLVIGAYGKRSRLDKALERGFIQKKSPYIGVKYHIRTIFPQETIGLYNFRDGYCGVCEIEDGRYNLCYLSHRKQLKAHGNIKALEQNVLCHNPLLKVIYENADFVTPKPIVINEISFAPKKAVEGHILMSGDTAGMIAPLCGNGMAMAIHSAKILSELIVEHSNRPVFDRAALEEDYTQAWSLAFRRRLWIGRNVQRLFGRTGASALTVALAKRSKTIANLIIHQTHGLPLAPSFL